MFDPEYRLKQIDAQIKQLEEEKKRIENTILHAHTQASKQYAIWYAQSRFDEIDAQLPALLPVKSYRPL